MLTGGITPNLNSTVLYHHISLLAENQDETFHTGQLSSGLYYLITRAFVVLNYIFIKLSEFLSDYLSLEEKKNTTKLKERSE